MTKFILALLLTLSNVFAYDSSIGLGAIGVSNFESDEKGFNDQALLKSYGGGGLAMEGELRFFGPLLVIVGGQYFAQSAKLQYDDTASSSQVADLKATMAQLNLQAGLRFQFIRIGGFALFASGGINFGNTILSFEEEEYQRKNNNSLTGYKEEGDSASHFGQFGDAGLQFGVSKIGVRLRAIYMKQQTKAFETLGNSRLNFNQTALVFNFYSLI